MSGYDGWPPPDARWPDDEGLLDLGALPPPDPAGRVDRPGPPGWAGPVGLSYPSPPLDDLLPPPLDAPPPGYLAPPIAGPPPVGAPIDFGAPAAAPADLVPPQGAPVDRASPAIPSIDVTPPPGAGPIPGPSRTIPPALVGFSALAANRVVLTLMASGARLVTSDVARAWLEVPGARIVVSEGDSTRLLIESADAERRTRVGDVVLQGLFREDSSVSLAPSHAAAPEPGPMPGTPAGGWYADPYRPTGMRRWDGRCWTTDTA